MARAAAADGLVSKTLDSLVNGVSQQPPSLRLDSQGAEQINMQSRVLEGPRTRPGTEHIARLTVDALPADRYHVHIRTRDELTQHVVLIENGDIRVFNLLTGAEATVTIAPDAEDYLVFSGDSAHNAFAVVSVADYTFIVNKEVTVAMSGVTSAARTNEFLIWITDQSPEGEPNNWSQTLGAVSLTKSINPLGGGIADPKKIVNALLYAGTGDDGTGPHGGDSSNEGFYLSTVGFFPLWTFAPIGGTIVHGLQTSGSHAEIGRPTWEWSDDSYEFIGESVAKFSDLPPNAPDDFTTEIIGEDGNQDNNYWVKYDGDVKAWVETVGPELDNAFDADTMPHALIQTGVDTFTFGPLTWADREKGDDATAPEPSFVGREISDIGFHKNRLVLTAGEHVVLSEAGEFFNFWPTTVATLVDSDPIDAAGTNNRIAPIDYMLPYDQKLYIFSAQGAVQNVLIGGDSLTNKNAEVVEASAFANAAAVRPKAVGRAIYFAVDRERSTTILEYTIADLVADAVDIAAHVPTYIPGNVQTIAASQKESMLVLFSPDTPNMLYVYSFFFDGPNKRQTAWSRWEFAEDYEIVGVEWVNEKLYIVAQRDDGLHLERIDLGKLSDGDLSQYLTLDSLVEDTGTFDDETGRTTWTLPYEATGTMVAVLTDQAAFGDELASALPLEIEIDGSVSIEGDFSAGPVMIGRRFVTMYEFSKPLIFQQGGDSTRGVEPVTQGRLQLRKFKVLVRASGGFYASVTSDEVNPAETLQDEDEFIYEYPEKLADAGTVGVMNPLPADIFSFDIGMNARHAVIRINSTAHLPVTLVAAEWQGFYTAQSARL